MINDIKAKLPLKKKAEVQDELDENEGEVGGQDATDPTLNSSDKTSSTDIRDLDEDEEVEEPKSLVDKLKAKFAPKKKLEAVADGKTKPKPKINPVVLIVVLAGLGFLFYESEEEITVESVPDVKPISKIKKVPLNQRPGAATVPADAARTAVSETPSTDAPITDAPATDTPVAETPTDAPISADPVAATPAEEPIQSEPVPADPILNDTQPENPVIADDPTTDIPVDAAPTDPTDSPVVTDSPITPDPTLAPESVDSVDGQIATDESSMTDKILEDLEKQVKKDQPKEVKKEYVAPPDYEYKGRGLVYNCAGKHWACVDAPSYKTCEDNYSSVTFKKKTIECYPFNVYESTKGCESMQNRVVSSNAKTGFCKGN